MSKFVRLTEVLATGEVKSLIVNLDYAVHVQSGMKGKDTHIRMHNNQFYFVKESIDEVERLIGVGLANLNTETVHPNIKYVGPSNAYQVQKQQVL